MFIPFPYPPRRQQQQQQQQQQQLWAPSDQTRLSWMPISVERYRFASALTRLAARFPAYEVVWDLKGMIQNIDPASHVFERTGSVLIYSRLPCRPTTGAMLFSSGRPAGCCLSDPWIRTTYAITANFLADYPYGADSLVDKDIFSATAF